MNGQRMLSEPEAWRDVARMIAENCGAGVVGLATGSVALFCADRISRAQWDCMYARSSGFLGNEVFSEDWRGECVLAALWLALEAEDEVASTRLAAEIQEGR